MQIFVVNIINIEKIIALGQSIANKKNIIAQKYNAMNPSQKEKNRQMVSRYEFLDFKLYSLSDIFLLKKGRLKMKFPEKIELPMKFKTECGIKKLIKNMFNKNKK